MSDSDQRIGRKLSARRGRAHAPSRSPNKLTLTRLFRAGATQTAESSFTQDNRRNAVLLDVTPEDLRPPSRASVASVASVASAASIANTISTSRFSLISPPSPTSELIRSSSKRLLPKLRDHLSTRSKHQRLFVLRKRRRQRITSYQPDGEPLDGEEGELIDDEACYMDLSVSKGMGKHPLGFNNVSNNIQT
jgi:hypothetical protein